MRQWLIRSVAPILNLFLESQCALCERSTDKALCSDCQRQAYRCQLTPPTETWQGNLPVFAWGVYKGALKRAIAALKYDNQPQIARLLGYWLGEAWLAHAYDLHSPLAATRCQTSPPWIIPIPLHADKLKLRGYNQTALIAESFCAVTGLRFIPTGLVRVRPTKPQFSLTAKERRENLVGAFQIGRELRRLPANTSVLLLDDIYTTGSTALSAANTLQQHKISVMGIGAIARSMK